MVATYPSVNAIRKCRLKDPPATYRVNGRFIWFCHTFRDAGRLAVVLWGLWLVNAVAGCCFRICHRW
jgi:hypothetical protein